MELKNETNIEDYLNKHIDKLRAINIDYVQQIDNVLPKEMCKYFIDKLNKYIDEKRHTKGYRTTEVEGKKERVYNDKLKNCSDVFFIPNPSIEELKKLSLEGKNVEGFINIDNDEEIKNNIKKLIEILFHQLYYYLLNVGYLGFEYIGTTKENIEEAFPQFNNKKELSEENKRVSFVLSRENVAISSLTLRKYEHKIGGGYHIPHMDDLKGPENPRLMSMILYLNDVGFGGETEFPIINKSLRPKQGSLGIFPPYFTHFHFGQRASEDKYVFTIHFALAINPNKLNNKEKSK